MFNRERRFTEAVTSFTRAYELTRELVSEGIGNRSTLDDARYVTALYMCSLVADNVSA